MKNSENAFVERRSEELIKEAVEHLRLKDYEAAEVKFRTARQLHPSVENTLWLGWCFSLRGQTDAAIELAREALESDPQSGLALADLGQYLIAKGRFDEAIQYLNRSLKAEHPAPDHLPHLHLGRALAYQGQHQKALEAFEEAQLLAPHMASVRKLITLLRRLLR